jgi:pyruvate formate lyase activating enzyme
MVTGIIFDIKRFAIHDGPGIRTTVFLKGCPLECWWCHNPESREREPAVHDGKLIGREIAVPELIATLERDRPFHDESGGGVTFSGGEPLAQPEFLLAALDACGESEFHRTVDSTGHAPADLLRRVAAETDLFLYDLKLMDPQRHLRYTGRELVPILENLRLLAELGIPVEIRVPVIPGLNDDAANFEATGRFAAELDNVTGLVLLPYHAMAMHKYERFGLERRLPETPAADPTALRIAAERIAAHGLNVRVGGMDDE